MSFVDSDHIEPARRGRHGSHYFAKVDHAGKIKPAMKYKMEGAGEGGWECGCPGRTNWTFVGKCLICGASRPANA